MRCVIRFGIDDGEQLVLNVRSLGGRVEDRSSMFSRVSVLLDEIEGGRLDICALPVM